MHMKPLTEYFVNGIHTMEFAMDIKFREHGCDMMWKRLDFWSYYGFSVWRHYRLTDSTSLFCIPFRSRSTQHFVTNGHDVGLRDVACAKRNSREQSTPVKR